MKILFATLTLLTASSIAIAAGKAQVTTLESIPGKTCEIVGNYPGVSASEIRFSISGNPVTRSVTEVIEGIGNLASQQGANTVLGFQIHMIPMDRNKGKEFGDVIAVGTLANCK